MSFLFTYSPWPLNCCGSIEWNCVSRLKILLRLKSSCSAMVAGCWTNPVSAATCATTRQNDSFFWVAQGFPSSKPCCTGEFFGCVPVLSTCLWLLSPLYFSSCKLLHVLQTVIVLCVSPLPLQSSLRKQLHRSVPFYTLVILLTAVQRAQAVLGNLFLWHADVLCSPYYRQWQVCLGHLQQPRKHRGFLYNSSFRT